MNRSPRPNGEIAGCDAELAPGGRDFGLRARTAEFFVRRAQIDHLYFLRLHQSGVHDEVGGTLRDGDGNVGVALEQAIGDFLEPRRIGQVRVFVQNRGNTPHPRRHAAERRRTVTMEVEDIYLFAIDNRQQRGERRRIEFRFMEVRDIDAQRIERLF